MKIKMEMEMECFYSQGTPLVIPFGVNEDVPNGTIGWKSFNAVCTRRMSGKKSEKIKPYIIII